MDKWGKNYQAHLSKNVLAIDYGTKYVGLAQFQIGRSPFPTPYERLSYQSDDILIKDIEKVVLDESIDIIMLGIPYYLDGNESKMTKTIKTFGDLVKKHFPEVLFFHQDETLSSFEAESRMKNSPQYNFKIDPLKIDALAASIILEDWLKN